MALSAKQREKILSQNQREFGEQYLSLVFPDSLALKIANHKRFDYLTELQETAVFGAAGTKLNMHRLSPGCRICTEGGWSCLFINGKCNCRCFYCPTAQDEVGEATTNSVEFVHPADYVAYLERLGFTGSSISGGEPLMTPERSIAFIRAIKDRFGPTMHVWLYTNGVRIKKFEAMTENGFIRTLTLLGEPVRLDCLISSFRQQNNSDTLWCLNSAKDRLTLHPNLWVFVEPEGLRLLVAYSAAYQR